MGNIRVSSYGFDTGRNTPVRGKVQVWIDGVCFEHETSTKEQAQSLALHVSRALGLDNGAKTDSDAPSLLDRCVQCHGIGTIVPPESRYGAGEKRCPSCNGTGKVRYL